MSLQTWGETLISSQSDSSALTTSTTPTSILPTGAVYTLPANWMQIGRVLLIRAHGRVSNVVTTPGTLTLEVRFGSVVAASSGAIALNTTAKTNVPWVLEWMLTCRSIGASTSATVMHQGTWTSESVVGSPVPASGGAGCAMLPNSAPAVGTGFDSTAAFAINLFGTWSINNADSITTHGYTLTAMN